MNKWLRIIKALFNWSAFLLPNFKDINVEKNIIA